MGTMWTEEIPRSVRAYTALITAYGNAGQWEWAQAVMDVMSTAKVAPTAQTYNALIAAYGKGLQWELAEAALEAMEVSS
jgi:pentatricopeptide repeat protein